MGTLEPAAYRLGMLSSQDVAAVEFPVVKWTPGYEIEGVQELLKAIGQTLAAYETGDQELSMVTARQLKNPRIYPTKFRDGWDKRSVDEFLSEACDTLLALERAGA